MTKGELYKLYYMYVCFSCLGDNLKTLFVFICKNNTIIDDSIFMGKDHYSFILIKHLSYNPSVHIWDLISVYEIHTFLQG